MRVPRSAAALIIVLIVAACTAVATPQSAQVSPGTNTPSPGLQKLEHLIFIVQENRSFDQYFGTYPGTDGIPTNRDGSFKPCIPNKYNLNGDCARPYVTDSFEQDGGPHNHIAAVTDVAGGAMDGFITALHPAPHKCPLVPTGNRCDAFLGPDRQPDVMSTHDRATIPNYWAYADDYVLQDHLFAPVDSWTLPAHLFLVSAWSAVCPDVTDPMSCQSDVTLHGKEVRWEYGEEPVYAWTDITWLLDANSV